MDFLFNTVWGWLGIAGVIAVGCGLVAWFLPPFRRLAIEVAAVALSAAAIYAKATRDRANLEAKRKEEAVAKARKEYADIEARPDTPNDVSKRLRDGGF